MPKVRLLLCIILLCLVHAILAWQINRPVDAGIDVPSGKLASLSFAPFPEGYNPLEKTFPSYQLIDEDMQLLADKTRSIRTYTSMGGAIAAVPEIAQKYGVEVIQGGWLGSTYADNQKEIAALIKAANSYPNTVKRVIVGNEVLLRGDLEIDRLIEYIREVKRAVKQPVSYADVWSMYVKHPQLIKEVDFITIHILPYWEDEPIAVERAPEHLEAIVNQVEEEARQIAPGKKILIGESGWPSAGRQRGLAAPSVVNSAKYIRSMIEVVNKHGFDYNIVEAFNQPWKSDLEGVVGANWGLLSADRKPVFPLTGPVSENPSWAFHFVVATLIFLTLSVYFATGLTGVNLPKLAAFSTLALLFSICITTVARLEWYTSYDCLQRLYTATVVIGNGWLGLLLLRRYLDIFANAEPNPGLAGQLRVLYYLFIALALFKTCALAFNGRYLSFPTEQFYLPCLGLLGLIGCLSLQLQKLSTTHLDFDQLIGDYASAKRYRVLAYSLTFAATALIVGETSAFFGARDLIQAHPAFSGRLAAALNYTLTNGQLITWLLCLLVLSIPFGLKTKLK
ncbi:glycosyl hydrolase family 17 protein [Methylomonas sp. HYX-M1]|uniref:glycoside hydrolase family 17 protein n=1 Tax=Methylomonas sp. HYX-M1 TaxID=3139307 RepID=UPI00345B5304